MTIWITRNKYMSSCLNIDALKPRRNRRHFADDIFKCISLIENMLISITISLKFIPTGPSKNIYISAFVQIMVCRLDGDKPLSEPMMVILLTYICVTRPQWVNSAITQLGNHFFNHFWYLWLLILSGSLDSCDTNLDFKKQGHGPPWVQWAMVPDGWSKFHVVNGENGRL